MLHALPSPELLYLLPVSAGSRKLPITGNGDLHTVPVVANFVVLVDRDVRGTHINVKTESLVIQVSKAH